MPDSRSRAEKLRAMADHPRSDPNEADNARRLLAESEEDYLARLEREIDAELGLSQRAGRRATDTILSTEGDVSVQFEGFRVWVDGRDVTDEVRWDSVSFSR